MSDMFIERRRKPLVQARRLSIGVVLLLATSGMAHGADHAAGLIQAVGPNEGDGNAKSQATNFRILFDTNAIDAADANAVSNSTQTLAPAPTPQTSRRNPSDRFTLWTNSLSGKTAFLIASDPKREINHAHVSPDRGRIVFTRYNIPGPDGSSQEVNGYFQTEAVICHVDGSNCEIVLPQRRGVMDTNAYWTPDGTHLIYVTNDNPSGTPGVAILDLGSRQISHIPSPPGMAQTDPDMVGNLVVSPSIPPWGGRYSVLSLYDITKHTWRQLTAPKIPGPPTNPLLGDHDPELSPDGRWVAVMRHLAQNDWATFIVNVATSAENDLSGPHPVDAVPEWSSDGRLLIFWHVDRLNLMNSGIYTMTPEGSNRVRVPLAHGFLYTMPTFFPGDGSGSNARIVYSAQPQPLM